jgi:hypothetical protein
MSEIEISGKRNNDFHLSKWFLDFISEKGEVMIFYAAKLVWHGLKASYTSWLSYSPQSGVNSKSRFYGITMPIVKEKLITWSDSRFGVSGTWTSNAEMVSARLYDSPEGFLDWMCFQPASEVKLTIGNRKLIGKGYAEQLILTVPPWKIPMNELRWGRFVAPDNYLVWIDLKGKEDLQWLWVNGEEVTDCEISDYQINVPGKKMVLSLDRAVELESEKKIFSVVEKVLRYLPGFKKSMPLNFLMADEVKWLSNCQLHCSGNMVDSGKAIHELVLFNLCRT